LKGRFFLINDSGWKRFTAVLSGRKMSMEAIQLNIEEFCSYLYRLKDNEYDVRQKLSAKKKEPLEKWLFI
jgi:hypothetical protein